jgi:hypothetical protein
MTYAYPLPIEEKFMAKLVTIYESYIERPRLTEMRVPTTGHATHTTRARRAEEHQHRLDPGYEHCTTEELCARGRLLGIDIDSIGTRDRLIVAIRRATRKRAIRRR